MDAQATVNFNVDDLIGRVAAQIKQAGYRPTRVLALARGGFVVAAAIAKALDIQGDNVVGVPVEKCKDGKYRIAAWFEALMPAIVRGQLILLVDDSSISGMLTNGVKNDCIKHYGAKDARSCVVIASVTGLPSDFVGATCKGKPPKFQ